MRDDICTIPVSEVFEVDDGCPICRMKAIIEKRIVDYIMGDAMMEPDVRISTNEVGFCEKHYDKMMANRGRLQLTHMLQTHIAELNEKVFTKKFLTPISKQNDEAKKILDSCFICSKIEFGMRRMIDTIYRCYENEKDFRNLFDNQSMFCLKHYELLSSGVNKHNMKRYGGDFLKSLNRITGEYSKKLYDDLSEFAMSFDYRSAGVDLSNSECKNSVERTVDFLSGRIDLPNSK